MWFYIIVMIISAVLARAMAPKIPPPKPPQAVDFNAPPASENAPIPVVFGTVWVRNSNVVWYGQTRSLPIIKCTTVSGGK